MNASEPMGDAYVRDSLNLARVGSVTVTYHPDFSVLERQLRGLPAECHKVIVDNTGRQDSSNNLLTLKAAIHGVSIITNDTNVGLPAAINIGVRWLEENRPEADYVFFLDQDSEPEDRCLHELLFQYEKLIEGGYNPGGVGPRIIDQRTGLEHGFHCIQGLRWVRRYSSEISGPITCAGLNCSGTLVKIGLVLELGGLEEDLFIDQLDTEWSFRVSAAGYQIFGISTASLVHRMGEASWKFWFLGWRVWPYRSSTRHYYLFRNAVWLLKRSYVPMVWKLWAIPKLGLTLCVHLFFDNKRVDQLRQMTKGVRAGAQSKQR